jgi:hypothetical protein
LSAARKFFSENSLLGEQAKRYIVDRSIDECIRYLREYSNHRKGLINVFQTQLEELSNIANDHYEFSIQGFRNKRLVVSLRGQLLQMNREKTSIEYSTCIEKKFFYRQILFSLLVAVPLFYLLLQGFSLTQNACLPLVLIVPIVWVYTFRKLLLNDADDVAHLVDEILTR